MATHRLERYVEHSGSAINVSPPKSQGSCVAFLKDSPPLPHWLYIASPNFGATREVRVTYESRSFSKVTTWLAPYDAPAQDILDWAYTEYTRLCIEAGLVRDVTISLTNP